MQAKVCQRISSRGQSCDGRTREPRAGTKLLASWMLLQISSRCWLNISALQTQADKLSDHAPVHMKICRKRKTPNSQLLVRSLTTP
eukprot:10372737-Karenia_brevis.AAC.1